jgi:hypothetical protein
MRIQTLTDVRLVESAVVRVATIISINKAVTFRRAWMTPARPRLGPVLFTQSSVWVGQAIVVCRLPVGPDWQTTTNDGLPHKVNSIAARPSC